MPWKVVYIVGRTCDVEEILLTETHFQSAPMKLPKEKLGLQLNVRAFNAPLKELHNEYVFGKGEKRRDGNSSMVAVINDISSI